jgi:hypothetical protein
METCECFSSLVESERASGPWPDKRLVWIVAIAGCLAVNFGVVAGAVYVGRLLWA